ncbi:MFS transporter [Altererythrobacter sp. BO-6]|uniref:MFS transporter n=1 Tax=Altererythrobacter sp. BO-6 TaxID=2604537 RepID=UPI0013E16BA9|nr:MFS transporter [Altererythrobacter sp. BO-6]QIG53614.1 MFS transporter [Altererythrobacter sp. BO-6]
MATTAPATNAASRADDDTLSVSLKLGWGSGAFGIALLMNGIAGLILLFAASILQIEPWLAGTVIFLAKLIDVVTDPIVGVWSDRFESPRGRRRPFLFWGAITGAASFALIFTTPSFESQYVSALYLFVVLSFYAIAYTIYNIPYISMPAEMTDSYHERSSIHAYRMVFVSLGSLIASAGIKFALERLGKTEAESYAIVGIVCAVLIFISLMIAYYATASARFTQGTKSTKSNAAQMVEEFGAVRSNHHFLRLLGVKFAQLMGVQTTLAAFAYFFVQTLERNFDVLAIFGLVSTAASIISAPLLVRFSKRFGKRNTYYLAASANVLYALSWSLASDAEPAWALFVRAAVIGFAFSGNVVMAMSMLTDIINADANRTGVRREGAFTALYSFVEKLTAAVGPLIVGFALSIAGFNNKLPFDVPQGGNVNFALLVSVSWLPALFGLMAIWLLSGYRLNEDDINRKHDQVTT